MLKEKLDKSTISNFPGLWMYTIRSLENDIFIAMEYYLEYQYEKYHCPTKQTKLRSLSQDQYYKKSRRFVVIYQGVRIFVEHFRFISNKERKGK
jgi:hypothetical protein